MPTRPLTVTCVYIHPNRRDPIFHQMILESVENDEYVLQNTLHSKEIIASQRLPLLRIKRGKHYYVDNKTIKNYYDQKQGDYMFHEANNEVGLLTSEGKPTMKKEEWYILPNAYEIKLTPK